MGRGAEEEEGEGEDVEEEEEGEEDDNYDDKEEGIATDGGGLQLKVRCHGELFLLTPVTTRLVLVSGASPAMLPAAI